MMDPTEKEKWLEAGKIGKTIRDYAVSISKPGTLLLDLAKEIEKKTSELGAKPAFPPNLSINQIAAHYTPKYNDKTLLQEGDVLKIDVGASVDGFLSDTAATVVIGGEEIDLLKATREALEEAIKLARPGAKVDDISRAIETKIKSYNLSPIVNLGGHGLNRYEVHEGEFIANSVTNSSKTLRVEGAIAIEPFATTGGGYVIDSPEVQILMLERHKQTRSRLGRQILEFIESEYKTMPFSKRWIVEKFGVISEIELKNLVREGALYEFNVLKEKDNGLVSQFEHTLLFDNGEVIVTTL
ncbi:MAG: type II methionyl aminopeptidase [Candidatus Parvarchaeota archaeon]|jgi:methionyl aminopeptidase|nr:type II methionyl aminopeptidase [Candidatus Parvarchaeota archaeon]